MIRYLESLVQCEPVLHIYATGNLQHTLRASTLHCAKGLYSPHRNGQVPNMMILRITHGQSVVAEILLKLQDSLQHKLLNHQLLNKASSIMQGTVVLQVHSYGGHLAAG